MPAFSATTLTVTGEGSGPHRCDESFSSMLLVQISGVWTGTLRVLAQMSDGTQEIVSVLNRRTNVSTDGINANGLYAVDTSGFSAVLIKAEVLTGGAVRVLPTVVIG